jgi:DNA mismatch repair protein MutH
MRRLEPPRSRAELWLRARSLAGRRVDEVAAHLGATVPASLHRDKGFIGELAEHALGAHAPGRSDPDFPDLEVELKTAPVDASGAPIASTWVGAAPGGERWEDSHTRRKLSTVLWIPVLPAEDVAERRFGAPTWWRPGPAEEAVLRQDWETAVERLALGEAAALRSHHGVALQIRPKAARADVLAWSLDADGEWVRQTPVGWYLRREFTAHILLDPPDLAGRLARRGFGLDDDALRLDPWRPDWPEAGALAVAALTDATGGAAWQSGSTSVPGLDAKPILDLVAGSSAMDPAFEALGFVSRGEFGIPGRRLFTLPVGRGTVAHLHCFAPGDPRIDTHRAFAARLRHDDALRDAYQAEKRRLVATVARPEFSASKAPWFAATLGAG